MHNSCAKDCWELVVIGCAHSTVARWVSVLWGGRKVGNKTGAGRASNYSSWRLHFVWEDITGYEHVQNNQVRLVLVFLPARKCHAESESIKMYAHWLPKCLSEIRSYVWKLPDFVWVFMDVEVKPSSAGSLHIMRCEPIHMNLTWRSDYNVNNANRDHHICANINRNRVSWKSCSVSIMIARVSYCTCCPSWHDSKHCLLSNWQDSDWLV